MSHLYKKTIKEKSFEKVNDPSNVKIRRHVVKNDNTQLWESDESRSREGGRALFLPVICQMKSHLISDNDFPNSPFRYSWLI